MRTALGSHRSARGSGAGSGAERPRQSAEEAEALPRRSLAAAGRCILSQSWCRGRGRRGSPGSRGARQLSAVRSLKAPVSPRKFCQTPARPNSARSQSAPPGPPWALGAAASLRSCCCCRYVGSPDCAGCLAAPKAAPQPPNSSLVPCSLLFQKSLGPKGLNGPETAPRSELHGEGSGRGRQ